MDQSQWQSYGQPVLYQSSSRGNLQTPAYPGYFEDPLNHDTFSGLMKRAVQVAPVPRHKDTDDGSAEAESLSKLNHLAVYMQLSGRKDTFDGLAAAAIANAGLATSYGSNSSSYMGSSPNVRGSWPSPASPGYRAPAPSSSSSLSSPQISREALRTPIKQSMSMPDLTVSPPSKPSAKPPGLRMPTDRDVLSSLAKHGLALPAPATIDDDDSSDSESDDSDSISSEEEHMVAVIKAADQPRRPVTAAQQAGAGFSKPVQAAAAVPGDKASRAQSLPNPTTKAPDDLERWLDEANTDWSIPRDCSDNSAYSAYDSDQAPAPRISNMDFAMSAAGKVDRSAAYATADPPATGAAIGRTTKLKLMMPSQPSKPLVPTLTSQRSGRLLTGSTTAPVSTASIRPVDTRGGPVTGMLPSVPSMRALAIAASHPAAPAVYVRAPVSVPSSY